MKRSDTQRIEQQVSQERAKLLSFVQRRVGIAEDAEDILQDVLLKFFISYDTIESIEKVAVWLYQVARNQIVDRHRSAQHRVNQNRDRDTAIDEISDENSATEQSYLHETLIESLDVALQKLPQEQRDVYVMHELEGRSFKDIASATGISMHTLLSRKRYAVNGLKHELHDIYEALTER